MTDSPPAPSPSRKELEVELAWAEHAGWVLSDTPLSRLGGQARDALRHALAGAQNWRCCYQGCRMSTSPYSARGVTIEHVVPVILRGSSRPANLVAACRSCNVMRGSDVWPIHRQCVAILGVAALTVDPEACLADPTWVALFLDPPPGQAAPRQVP